MLFRTNRFREVAMLVLTGTWLGGCGALLTQYPSSTTTSNEDVARHYRGETNEIQSESWSPAARCVRVEVLDDSLLQLPVSGASVVVTEGEATSEQVTQNNGQVRICMANAEVPMAQQVAINLAVGNAASHVVPKSAADGLSVRVAKPGFVSEMRAGAWGTPVRPAAFRIVMAKAPATGRDAK